MPLSINDLKDRFESGDKPLGSDFSALIDATYGTDQILSFDPVSGDLGISKSDGSGEYFVNLNDLIDTNLSFTWDAVNRLIRINKNGVNINLGPLNGIWNTGTGGKLYYNAGNVGIGTSSPAHKLDVSGTGRFTGVLTLQDDLAAQDINASGSLKFSTSANTVNRITNSVDLAGNSNVALPTERAVKTYVDNRIIKNEFHLGLNWTAATHFFAGDNAVYTAASAVSAEGAQLELLLPGSSDDYAGSVAPSTHQFVVGTGQAGRYQFIAAVDFEYKATATTGIGVWIKIQRKRGSTVTTRDIYHNRNFYAREIATGVGEFDLLVGDIVSLRLKTAVTAAYHFGVRGGYFIGKRLPS